MWGLYQMIADERMAEQVRAAAAERQAHEAAAARPHPVRHTRLYRLTHPHG